MAKKAQAETIEVAPPKTTTKVENKKPKDTWEIKDRNYYLTGNKTPLTYKIPSRHTTRHALLWYDEKNNKQREIRYATNQNSPFKDEQNGEATLGHIMFNDGHLSVSKKNQSLQKILSLYHPLLGITYKEMKPEQIAKDELADLEIEVDALNMARSMDIDQAEAILRTEIGTAVSTMSSKEIKRDLLQFAKYNPYLFIDLAQDENVELRNFAIKATEANIIKLADDNRTFMWSSNGKKLMTVPFDEHPYSAMAAFFKTDEGLEIYKSIEKKFS
tara:strand:- start:12334 stop:13152 length:819 start_codon:yes stop_codon:yes gene_type:complete